MTMTTVWPCLNCGRGQCVCLELEQAVPPGLGQTQQVPVPAKPTVQQLATELVQAKAAVRQEMQQAAERGMLATNGQCPSWPAYEKAQRAWDELPDLLVEGKGI